MLPVFSLTISRKQHVAESSSYSLHLNPVQLQTHDTTTHSNTHTHNRHRTEAKRREEEMKVTKRDRDEKRDTNEKREEGKREKRETEGETGGKREERVLTCIRGSPKVNLRILPIQRIESWSRIGREKHWHESSKHSRYIKYVTRNRSQDQGT